MKIVPEYRQVVFADGAVDGIADIAVDIEDECYGGVAAEDVGGILDVCACRIVVDAVECVRQVVLVDSDMDGGFEGLVNGQMQGVGAFAFVAVFVDESAAGGVVPFVPLVALAFGHRFHIVCA